ncbi:Transmembrane protein 231 [Popillia japonica]|uniref:Transmembrane protein 231 n=1 Tax=Popillia japonica TaxID=7064 RepID=A0AAW1K2R7_POPJA
MVIVLELYSKSLKTTYKNHLCSKATFFILLINLIKIALPFLLCCNGQGFRMRYDTFHEQPDVRFTGEYLFIGYTNNISFPIICSNIYWEVNNQDNCILIQAREIDTNYDGKIDEFTFKLTANLPKNVKIHSFELLLPIDYMLHETCPINMQSMIFLQETLNNFMNMLSITSVLEISQKFPLQCYSNYMNRDYNSSTVTFENFETYSMDEIVKPFNKRNLTTHLSDTYKSYDINTMETFLINFNILYPEHIFYYEVGFWKIVKSLWIQYLSIYIVLNWLIKKAKDYIFDKHLILFYETSPINKM